MREPSPMSGDKNLGVTLSRTLIPTLPSGYLSRKRLFPLIDNEPGGTTFVIAPGGYGKSSLVAQWAQYQSNGVIWMTVANGDTVNEMSAMLIIATRQVIPNFAPWFEKEQPLRSTEVVRRWGNELMMTGRQFVYVLDNLRNDEVEDVDIAIKLIEQFPSNIHFIAIRREEIKGIYPICASRGPIKVVTQNDLRFNEDEIEQYAANAGLELTDDSRRMLLAADGWPSATSLLRAHLQGQRDSFDLESVMGNQQEPLRALAMMVIKNIDPKISNICEKLSVLEVFTLEIAQVILGEEYSFDVINFLALRGEIFRTSRAPQGGYIFSPMVRQIFLENLRKRGNLLTEIHIKLMNYFEGQGQPNRAITHAFGAGIESKISELFPDAARALQAQGHGGDLLRWSVYAGDSSDEGELKRATVRATGLLADLDFGAARSEISKIRLLAENSPGRAFYRQFAAGAEMYGLLTLGKFNELEKIYPETKSGEADCYLGVDDQIAIIRVLATKRYIWNEAEKVEELYELSQKLGSQTKLQTSHAYLAAIQAMHLHQRGEYRRAYETATNAISQINKYGYVGNHGPLDVMYVAARNLLEFAKPQEAMALFEEIKAKAYQWKQWHWYITCDDNIFQFLTYNGNINQALERMNQSREFVANLDPSNELSVLIDINEMNIRRKLKDYDRLEKLVNRAPNIRNTQHFRQALSEDQRKKSFAVDVKVLPDKTPRDLIWKLLSEVSSNIDIEHTALSAMRKAMQVGAEVGARETFLRQSDQMGNLIIKVANEFPTVYNEELATAMAARIKERGESMTTAQQALTKRELEILRQLSTGRTLTVISSELHISQNTMKTHLKNLYKKMGAEGRHDAVEKAKATFLL